MTYRDAMERRWILEQDFPYWFDECAYCGSYEDEPHADNCDWQRIRREHNLLTDIAA